ncbi:MAG: AsmA family protein [Kiritimatiellae bacterium]|nr:AsmA family protein [Kiritimatiellia bacterium]MDD5523325.1 AsmA family protein [Kiritimatiellia bacterium]
MTYQKKTVLIIACVLALLIVIINVFLFFGLTSLAKNALPEITKTTGLNIDFNRLWVTLPSATIKCSGLKIGNPEGFTTNNVSFLSMDKASINIGILSLARGIIDLSSVCIKESRLTIIKNETGKINVATIGDITKSTSQKKQSKLIHPKQRDHEKPSGDQEQTESSQILKRDTKQEKLAVTPKAVIGNARINTIVEYVDYQSSSANGARLALDLHIRADGVTTFGNPETANGSFSVNGHLEGKPHALVINIKGKIAPLSNPEKPTFEVYGTITNICTRDFKEFADVIGIESDCIDIDINVKCQDGSYSRGVSIIKVKTTNLKLTAKSAGKLRGTSISNLSVSIPLKGTVQAPDFDFLGTLLGTLMGNLDGMIKSINVDQKSIDKQINNFFNSVLGGKKKKR